MAFKKHNGGGNHPPLGSPKANWITNYSEADLPTPPYTAFSDLDKHALHGQINI